MDIRSVFKARRTVIQMLHERGYVIDEKIESKSE